MLVHLSLLREGFKGMKEAATTEVQEVRTDVHPDVINRNLKEETPSQT
jgi:hypothetical protein